MWRNLNTLFPAVYERIEFAILAPGIEVAPNCTQSDLLSVSAQGPEIKEEEWLPGLDSN
jgi:hypothetical protein